MPLMTTRKTPRPGSEEWWKVRDDRRRSDRLSGARRRLIGGNLAPQRFEPETFIAGQKARGVTPDWTAGTGGMSNEDYADYIRMRAEDDPAFAREHYPATMAGTAAVRPVGAAAAPAPRQYSDAELGAVGRTGADLMAYKARQRAVAPGGAAAGIEGNVQRHRARMAVLSRGYGAPPPPVSGAAALVGGGEFTVHPSETPEKDAARARLLTGQRSAFLQAGTRGGDAYNAVLEAGGDEAAARDAVTAVQGQEMMSGPPLTGGDLALEQAATEARTAAAEAQAAMARAIAADPVKYIAQQSPIEQMDALIGLSQAMRNAGLEKEADEVDRKTAEMATGKIMPPDDPFWIWVGKTIAENIRAPYDIAKGVAAGISGGAGGQ